MTTVTYNKNSPYYGTDQVMKYIDYLGFWKGIAVLPNSNDMLMILDSKYNKRPDLLSFDLYGTAQLWWVFMIRNPDVIRDPIYDFITGINLYTPSRDSLKRFM
jgi:hypothetical protein